MDFATELPAGIYRHDRPPEASTPTSQGVRPPRHSRTGVVSAVTSGLMGVAGGGAALPVKVGRALISAGAAGRPESRRAGNPAQCKIVRAARAT
ncbi:hypothetical protein GCM10022214_39030 [Actinomadura miaoliensis]|uniref:Uncharacterized protein n=1 Tax=Actinomadura miaoliensis TaxID=430685 RepID=A0ABP7VYX6_9ACTN